MNAHVLHNDPDRLFPADPGTRAVARRIYAATAELPILSPHGHVPPVWLADDVPFRDPTSLLVTPDHYITRILHAGGLELFQLGVGRPDFDETSARAGFRLFCEHWADFDGTAMRYWMIDQLVSIFGVTQRPSVQTADAIYDQIADWIARASSRPRALMDAFGIEFLATTDDPCDDLGFHDVLAADASFSARHRVVPTFRPDKYLEPGRPDWVASLDALAQACDIDCGTLAGFTAAMEDRRAYFAAHGAVSSDHSHADLETLILEPADAQRLFTAARAGVATPSECDVLRRHLVTDQMRMACDDGLVMTLHPGIIRSHDEAAMRTYGADIGCDIPARVEVAHALRTGLEAYGNHPNFHLVLFTCDETVYSREVAPLAGWYRGVYIGVPWWFLDQPEAVLRFKRAVTGMAGFSRLSGMVDDTRAFCSIPARHDMSRRLDAAHLAELVVTHQLDEDEAVAVAIRLVADNPRQVFKI